MSLLRGTSLLSNGTRLVPGPRRLAVAIVATLVSFTSGSGQGLPSLKGMISGGFRAALVYSPLSPEWGAYDMAADGKRFLVDSMDQMPAPEPINLIVNWDVQLKN